MARHVCLLLSLLVMLGLAVLWLGPFVFKRLAVVTTPSCPVKGIVGPPSLSADFVNAVLDQYRSPASGTGQALYEKSAAFCIDDAVALAFFQHESGFGRAGIAVVNHSLGNIRCSSGYSCRGGFRSYASWEDGYTDWFSLIKSLYVEQWRATTVEAIIPHYAPVADHNNEQAYISAVKTAVAKWRAGRLS